MGRNDKGTFAIVDCLETLDSIHVRGAVALQYSLSIHPYLSITSKTDPTHNPISDLAHHS